MFVSFSGTVCTVSFFHLLFCMVHVFLVRFGASIMSIWDKSIWDNVPRIRPSADIVHYKYIFTYLLTY